MKAMYAFNGKYRSIACAGQRDRVYIVLMRANNDVTIWDWDIMGYELGKKRFQEMISFLMGTHSRVGEDSAIKILRRSDVLPIIYEMLFWSPFV